MGSTSRRKIEDETFINSQLNDMMEKYKENNINKDIFYEEEKRDRIKAARKLLERKRNSSKVKVKKQLLMEN